MLYPVGGSPALKKASPDEPEAIRRLSEKKSSEILPLMGSWMVIFVVAVVAGVAAAGVAAAEVVAAASPGLRRRRMRQRKRRRTQQRHKGTFQGKDASLRNRQDQLPDWLGIQRRTCRKVVT